MDINQVSVITFGYFDKSQIAHGGTQIFGNHGDDSWSTKILELKFGNWRLQKSNVPRIAHIDSANMHIQIPSSEFAQLEIDLQFFDKTIERVPPGKYDEGPHLIS